MRYICTGPRDDTGKRIGCGADLTQEILSVPQDGEEHTVVCPMCGNDISVLRMPQDGV